MTFATRMQQTSRRLHQQLNRCEHPDQSRDKFCSEIEHPDHQAKGILRGPTRHPNTTRQTLESARQNDRSSDIYRIWSAATCRRFPLERRSNILPTFALLSRSSQKESSDESEHFKSGVRRLDAAFLWSDEQIFCRRSLCFRDHQKRKLRRVGALQIWSAATRRRFPLERRTNTLTTFALLSRSSKKKAPTSRSTPNYSRAA